MKNIIIIFAIALSVFSCQPNNEIIETNAQVLTKDSLTTKAIRKVVLNDTQSDNFLDGSSCFSVKFPYVVYVYALAGTGMPNQLFTINNVSDLAYLKSVIGGRSHAFQFPVTVINTQHVESVIATQAALYSIMLQCAPQENKITCYNFVYPIKIFKYSNSNQQNSILIFNNDKQFFNFINGLSATEYFSINYPVNYKNSSSNIIINSNSKLKSSIEFVESNCAMANNCQNPGILKNGLVLYMSFAGNMNDLTGFSEPQTIYSSISFVKDRSGNPNGAVYFPNTDYYQNIKIPGNSNNKIVQGDDVTISLWFKLDEGVNSLQKYFFTKASDDSQPQISLGASTMNQPYFGQYVANLYDGSWTSNLWTNYSAWHHLVITIDGTTNSFKMYRNGVLVDTQANSLINIGDTTLDYFIGSNFKGTLDDLRVYRRLLSQSEIQTLYALPGDIYTCL